MSVVVVAGLLVSASLFLIRLLFLPGNVFSPGTFWRGSKLAESTVAEAVRTVSWLRCWDSEGAKTIPPNVMPLQVAAGAMGLLAGLVVSMVLPFPSVRWLTPLICGVSCYQLPALLLRHRLAARTRAVQRELLEGVGLLRALPSRNLATALAATTRARHGPLAAAISQALGRNATGDPLLKALQEALAGLQVEDVGRFVEVLSQAQATSTRSGELLRAYEQDLLSRRREAALRRMETAEGKISAVLTVTTAVQLLLLLVVPSLLRFLALG